MSKRGLKPTKISNKTASAAVLPVKVSRQEKALRNAKFGVVDPETERRLRAAKFGTYHPDNEAELHAKRLEKFGAAKNNGRINPLPVPLDQAELDKRRKRLQRFASDVKGSAVNENEEEMLRRKRRAERFGQVTVSQLNAHLTDGEGVPVDPATHVATVPVDDDGKVGKAFAGAASQNNNPLEEEEEENGAV